VIDGVPASGATWAFVAALIQHGADPYDGQFCGGSVIAPTVVLTAAHCVEGAAAGDIDVVTGRTVLSAAASGQRLAVRAIRVDPRYDPNTEHHDAALLLLAQPTSAPPVQVAGSADGPLIGPGQPLAIAGWGVVDNNADSPDALQSGVVHARSIVDCIDAYGSDVAASLMVCAGPTRAGQADSCPGDSGGPLVSYAGGTARLIGLVAFGGDVCGDPSAPGVYTRVSGELQWIAQTLGLVPAAPPRPPAQTVAAQIGTITCGAVLCSIDVQVSGSVAAVGRIVVTVTRGGTRPLRRSAVAARVSQRLWRAHVDLPFGRLLISAQPFNASGVAFGQGASQGVEVTAG
jgi:secreted trypsin-like serine protease